MNFVNILAAIAIFSGATASASVTSYEAKKIAAEEVQKMAGGYFGTTSWKEWIKATSKVRKDYVEKMKTQDLVHPDYIETYQDEILKRQSFIKEHSFKKNHYIEVLLHDGVINSYIFVIDKTTGAISGVLINNDDGVFLY